MEGSRESRARRSVLVGARLAGEELLRRQPAPRPIHPEGVACRLDSLDKRLVDSGGEKKGRAKSANRGLGKLQVGLVLPVLFERANLSAQSGPFSPLSSVCVVFPGQCSDLFAKSNELAGETQKRNTSGDTGGVEWKLPLNQPGSEGAQEILVG